MTKTCIVLYLYDLLKKHGKFKLDDIEEKFNCSKRTAARYIAELRKYFKLFDVPCEIEYVVKERSFKLINKLIKWKLYDNFCQYSTFI